MEEGGLQRFYALGGGRGQAVGSVPEPRRRDWLEDLERRGVIASDQVRVELDVQGIHCAACVWLLQELWGRRDGAVRIDLNPSLGQVTLVYDPKRLPLAAYLDDVERLGYRLAPASKQSRLGDRALLTRMGICIALALNAMMFALARYVGLSATDGALHTLFRGLSLALAAAAVVVGGPEFFRGALAGVRHRVLHLDLPISLGIVLAFAGSAAVMLRGGDDYFDTVTIFVALMLVGRFLQRRAVSRNRDYLLANDGAEHLWAQRLRGGRLERVPAAALAPGDHLVLAAGDLLPVRARLLRRPGSFSLDWISGESEPRAFAVGAVVPAGAFHAGRQSALLAVEAGLAESGLLRLLATPRRDTAGRHSAGGGEWRALNRIYVGLVLLLSAVAAVVWAIADPARILDVTTSVLVVTCPCALGLAIPLAFDLAVAGLRRRGIFVRSAGLLDRARRVQRVAFDKTGTLTWGGLVAQAQGPVPSGAELDVLFTMASSSSHPASRAVAAALASGPSFCADLSIDELPGRGLQCRSPQAVYRLGAADFATLGGAAADSACVFTRDGVVLARFALREDVRHGVAAELAELETMGLSTCLLSGDRQRKVARTAAAVGVPQSRAHGDLSPAQKADWIAAHGAANTMMVGDGLNDAPAFEVAGVAGTPALDRPVLPDRADFFYTGPGAGAVSAVVKQSRLFHRVVAANLWGAAFYNAVAVSLCFAGLMTPLWCAVLMPTSSLALLGHTAWRLGRWETT